MMRRQAAASRCQADRPENDLIREDARLRVEAVLAGMRRLDISFSVSNKQPIKTYARHNTSFGGNSDQATIEEQQQTAGGDAEGRTEAVSSAAATRNVKNTRMSMPSQNIHGSLPSRLPAIANRPSSVFSTRSIRSSRKLVPVSRIRAARMAREVTTDDLQVTSFITGGSFTVRKLQPHPMPKP